MKVYIKPWKEASECAKEVNNFLVDTSDDGRILSILNVTRQYGDWGHIIEAEKDNNGKFDRYITYYNGTESFSYPPCCVEEIDSAWLDAHAEIIDEQVVSQTIQYTGE